MLNYTLRRIVLNLVILWFLSVTIFVLMRVTGPDVALLQQGINATPEKVAAIHHELGLDKPMPVQYLDWVKGFVTLHLGRSVLNQVDITTEFKARFPVSLELMALTLVWTVTFGIPFGVISAMRRNSGSDYSVRSFAVLGLAVPGFWLATLVLMIPAQKWGYAPPLDQTYSIMRDPLTNLRQFLPPSLILAFAPMASVMRLTRSSLLEVLRADYVRTARAKGLAERVVVARHAMRNSMIPVLTVIGLQISGLLGGAVIIEQIFNLNGLGQYIFKALSQKDFAVAQTLVMYTAATVVTINLVIDLLYGVLDPRIRYA